MQINAFRIAAAGLLTASLTACSSASDTTASAASVPPSPSGSASAAPSASAAVGIPGGALLQPSDVRGAESQPLEKGEFSHVRPLRPCGDGRYPSDESRTAAVAMRYTVGGAEGGSTPTVVTEFVGLHTGTGAADQFTAIQSGLKECPGGLGDGERRWVVLDTGDDALVVRIDQRFSYADEAPSTVSHYAAASRVGNAIVVVADLGWENLGGSEELVRDLITKAEKRAATLA
ncbi:hypothetical protein FB565_008112 [Actinoplanes lutulentus]|uniref:PknH-like protein n=1 Tax=Actinoplanes lutulentus TaxID=1287878 RepID=A0A327Z401_9ACTN|nr:hypothetical protein [Actinoplanes lutulentus]MBB2948329.1 hypothetical protein [Actinoplanes lutulentus]RAK30361.1 hypothetical protein B0I29_11620 [Actinoplanes lutulentus]